MTQHRTGDDVADRARRFTATVRVDGRGRIHVPVPFDPGDAGVRSLATT